MIRMRGKQHRSIASDDLTPIAGGGLLDRRLFLKYGLAAGIVAGLVPRARAGEASPPDLRARPPWMREPGRPFSEYGLPSEHAVLDAHTLPGVRMPNREGFIDVWETEERGLGPRTERLMY